MDSSQHSQLVKSLQWIQILLQPPAFELQVYYTLPPLWRNKYADVLFFREEGNETRLLRV